MKPSDGEELSDFKPGQFLTVNLKIPREEIWRHYSLTGVSGLDYYRITVKKLDEGNTNASNFIHSLKKNDKI